MLHRLSGRVALINSWIHTIAWLRLGLVQSDLPSHNVVLPPLIADPHPTCPCSYSLKGKTAISQTYMIWVSLGFDQGLRMTIEAPDSNLCTPPIFFFTPLCREPSASWLTRSSLSVHSDLSETQPTSYSCSPISSSSREFRVQYFSLSVRLR